MSKTITCRVSIIGLVCACHIGIAQSDSAISEIVRGDYRRSRSWHIFVDSYPVVYFTVRVHDLRISRDTLKFGAVIVGFECLYLYRLSLIVPIHRGGCAGRAHIEIPTRQSHDVVLTAWRIVADLGKLLAIHPRSTPGIKFTCLTLLGTACFDM